MSQLSRLVTKLAQVQGRITEIEDAYPSIAKFKSSSEGYGVISITYQDFGPVATEYRSLLQLKEALETQIDAINGTENSSVAVAEFRNP